jgi:hypothetical protein
MNFPGITRRMCAIVYAVLPFCLFGLLVLGQWRHPVPELADPTSPDFNDFQDTVDWTLSYCFWNMLPSLPWLLWPLPFSFWLYKRPLTLTNGFWIVLSFLVFLFFAFGCFAGLAFSRMGW